MPDWNIVDATLALTSDQVGAYLTEVGASRVCDCGKGEHVISQEADGKPSLNVTTDPRDRNSENWFFWTVCSNCLKSTFYSAGHMVTRMKEKQSGE